MSSAGAQCDHLAHVSTQLPYAVTAAAVSFLAYIIAGFTGNPVIPIVAGIVVLIGVILVLRYVIRSNSDDGEDSGRNEAG
jgi:Na+/H+ antiporter NhaC